MRAEEYCPASGKVRHRSKREALNVHVKRQVKRRGSIPRYAYRCPDCGSWHATRLPPEARKVHWRKG